MLNGQFKINDTLFEENNDYSATQSNPVPPDSPKSPFRYRPTATELDDEQPVKNGGYDSSFESEAEDRRESDEDEESETEDEPSEEELELLEMLLDEYLTDVRQKIVSDTGKSNP